MDKPQNDKIRLILAEDQELLRKSFISLLKEDPMMEVMAEAGNGMELIELLKVSQPDIVLLDIEMPVMNGMQALEIICGSFPEVKVIMLTMHAGAGFIAEFMARGARAYLAKNCDPDTLFEAIHVVHTDGYYFDRNISEALLKGLQQQKTGDAAIDELGLSDKEVAVLKEICQGKTNKEISGALNLPQGTVDFHRSNLYKKTKSKNVIDLLKYAIKNQIINLN